MKASTYLSIIAFLSSASAGISYGQLKVVERVITWHSQQGKELHSAQDVNYECHFITRANKVIEFVQPERTITFTITRVKGNWLDLDKDGELVYDVKYEDLPGKIIISREDDQTILLLDFSKSAKEAINQKFIINRTEQE